MSRARTHTSGVGNQPLIQPLLEAVLCALVMIVSNVATMFGMRFNRGGRDWHTTDTQEALPQAKPDIPFKETLGPPGPCLAALKRSKSGPAVDAQRRAQTLTQAANIATPTKSFSGSTRESFFALAARKKDARVKPEHDTASVSTPEIQETDPLGVRVPRAGGDPVLRAAQTHTRRSALTRADQTPACAGGTVVGVVRLITA